MVKAMKAKVGSPLRKLVLIKLADNANDQGECWPSYKHIADQCEIDRRTAMRHVDDLEAQGFLKKEIRFGGPKGNSSNLFHLTIDRGVVSQSHQGSVTESPGGSVTESPRTSHSSEPVIEPLSSVPEDEQPSKKPKPEKPPFDWIMRKYNDICGRDLKKSALLTDLRIKTITQCWNRKVEGKLVFQSGKFWEFYFTWCLRDPHWRATEGKSWRASLEFVTRKDIVDRILDEMAVEGVFANEPA